MLTPHDRATLARYWHPDSPDRLAAWPDVEEVWSGLDAGDGSAIAAYYTDGNGWGNGDGDDDDTSSLWGDTTGYGGGRALGAGLHGYDGVGDEPGAGDGDGWGSVEGVGLYTDDGEGYGDGPGRGDE